MSYSMRYLITDDREVSPSEIEAGLKQTSPQYSIASDELLMYGEGLYGQLAIYHHGEEQFDDEMEMLTEDVEDNPEDGQDYILGVLGATKTIVFLDVLWQGRETEPTFERIDPLWEWLFANRDGLLHCEGEGYYQSNMSNRIFEAG